MRQRRFMVPGGLRGVAIILGITVAMYAGLSAASARSAATGVLAEELLYGLLAICALVSVALGAWRLRRKDPSPYDSLERARSKLLMVSVAAVLFPVLFLKRFCPSWWATSVGRVAEVVLCVVAFTLLLLATRPQRPSSSDGTGGVRQ